MEHEANADVTVTALNELQRCLGQDVAQRWLLVDVHAQRLWLMKQTEAHSTWPISTSAVGLDSRQDSGGTPPGVHRIAGKIGQGKPSGTVFESRQPTGKIWLPDEARDDDLILTRILTLTGCEPGLNQGGSVDSMERYIYLHGTNHEAQIGQPVSHGCVRLTNGDICQLFDLVSEGDAVVII
ncbi:MAG: lipoprotein-anchoring transpeptidase ErfK/SrfK [Candidatus Krumholzibacteriia bacterium]|jgi:lipoprotein-anchoring transpeptidase ErfK/SrfK